jgi:phosphate uptake regulator
MCISWSIIYRNGLSVFDAYAFFGESERPYSYAHKTLKRKVVKHGPSTFIVSLPAKWVKKNKVRKGDSLEVVPKGDTLLVSTLDHDELESFEADLTGLPAHMVVNLLDRAYRLGYRRVTLHYDSEDVLEAVQSRLQRLLGFVLLEQDERRCTVQAIAGDLEIDYDQSFERAVHTVEEMLSSIAASYGAGDSEALEAIRHKTGDVHTRANYCARQLNTGSAHPRGMSKSDSLQVLEELRLLAHGADKLARRLAKAPQEKAVLRALKHLQDQYVAAIEYYSAPTLRTGRGLAEAQQRSEDHLLSLAEAGIDSKLEACLVLVEQLGERVQHLAIAHSELFEEGVLERDDSAPAAPAVT